MADKMPSKTKDVDDKGKVQILQLTVLSVIVLLLAVCIIILSVFLSRDKMEICDIGYTVLPRDYEHPSVFDGLTPGEYEAVKKYMFSKTNLSLVLASEGTPKNAYIFMIDLLLPPKDKVIDHLDNGMKQPERKALVVVFRGDLSIGMVEEYEVGPLMYPTYHRKVNPNPIPFNFRPMDDPEYGRLFEIITKACETLYPLLIESYGLAYHNCTPSENCMQFYDVAPRGINDKERKSWFWGFRDVEGLYLHPLGLEIQIDHVHRTFSDWKILQIVYNGQKRASPELLLEDYKKGNIKKLKIPTPTSEQNLYSSYKMRGESEMKVPLQGPKLIEPEGHRYKIDGLHVTYMHWDFNINTKASTGVQLFDIKFQKERIAYELSFQEACVFYSGYGPAQGITNYYDVSWFLGAYTNELVAGVDCPDTATFLDVDFFIKSENRLRIKKGICVFEEHASVPLRRHYASDFHGSYSFYGGLGDYRLVVRSIANVWNYDYVFDYIFHLNGAIEVQVYSTGYVQSAFPLDDELRYGSKMTSFMMANIHQHLFHYKVDLDINGRSNMYSTLDISTETIKSPWYSNFNKTQFKFELNKKSTEEEANYKTANEARYDIFYNDQVENEFKNKRAYRILNHGKTPYLLSKSSETNAARWAKYPLAVSKYKDNEISSTSIYANNGPRNPVVDFEKFISDNETLENEDLVAWVTLGVLHIPHTEDIPSTTTAGSQVRFFLLPFNYFPECPSMSSPNAVHITPNGANGINLNTFGTSHESNCVQKQNGPASYDGRVYDAN
ncbi:amiloride-sensitive amine oxidase [copper-containing]-like [Mytilus trossulus]|uniref:amiloride-sensitive amine oxidase [copper-containing]-like n=1 Tax=Mytilus trossulus TaxID=6551 RepID=UPI00300747BD